MARNGLLYADVPLGNCSLSHSFSPCYVRVHSTEKIFMVNLHY